MTDGGPDEQLALLTAPVLPKKRLKPVEDPAPELPIARVAVDMPLAHLDRFFDYMVPASLHDAAVRGSRIKVRFAGKQVDGFIVQRVASTDHQGKLGVVLKVVSSEPVLSEGVVAATRKVADRYAGTLADVLRLAIPPRHARTEKEPPGDRVDSAFPDVDPEPWGPYDHGLSFLEALTCGKTVRACWSAVPGPDPAIAVAQAVLATLRAGNGAIVCVPDMRDVEQFDRAFNTVLGAGRHVTLTAAQGPAERYRAFLALSRGIVSVVVGTRAAAFAPVDSLGLVAIFDDGDDLFAEQRTPYPHAREVLLTRALDANCAVLVGGFARSSEAQMLVDSGWCVDLAATQATRRAAWPRVDVTDGSDGASAPARLPHAAFALIREALNDGPVLMQVPRRGYRASLACQDCREPARCIKCQGPLIQPSASAALNCRWCGLAVVDWRCGHCGGATLRAPVVGQLRTAEEISKAFPGARVLTSAGGSVLPSVGPEPVIVLATPGAEPHAEGGYAAAVLLDTWLQLGRPEMRVNEEAHRRWFNAIALVRPSSAGGKVVVVGDATGLQALVRGDPVGFARRELSQRQEAHLPPATRLATIDASAQTLTSLVGTLWPEPAEVLGPVPLDDDRSRLIVRVPRAKGLELAAVLSAAQQERSAVKAPALRVQVDPLGL
ncbi:MAG TPA: primosomal protein N' [Aeromicrobium sp.]|nr:primosomal protein N' [Aeromicrobium sp.]